MFSRILCSRAFSTFRILPRIGRIAWVAGSRACLAEPPAESPSTMNSSDALGSVSWQSASLPGRPPPSRNDLRRVRSRACLAASRALAAWLALRDDPLGVAGVLLEPRHEVLVDGGLDERAHRGVAELGLRLALELRLAQPNAHDRDEALADVLAEEVVLLLLEQALVARVAVDDVGERLLQALLVHAALVGVDRVRERVDRLRVAGGPLQGDVDLRVGLARLHRDDLGVDRLLARGEVLHEVGDAAGRLEDLLLGLGLPLVDQLDLDALGEERVLLQPLRQHPAVELDALDEDLGVGPERDDRPGLAGGLALGELGRSPCRARRPASTWLPSRITWTTSFSERAFTTETPTPWSPPEIRYPSAAELAPGVQGREDDLHGRTPVLGLGDRA